MQSFARVLPAFVLFASVSLGAQQWPDKPIRIVVPYPAGGSGDVVMRSAVEKMTPVLKQPIILENKPGAGGNIGAVDVLHAPADGTTWLWSTDSLLTVNPAIYQDAGFKGSDFVPVAIATQYSQVLVCHPSLGVRSLPELLAKGRAEKLSYASVPGGPAHLAMEMLISMSGVPMQQVPYKGPAPALQDVVGGHVPCGFIGAPTAVPYVQSGKLVAISVSGARRLADFPDVPTVAESGLPSYAATSVLVLSARKGTPEPILRAMNKAFSDALKQPDVRVKLLQNHQELVASSFEEATRRMDSLAATWGVLVKRIGLKLD